jgi:hypothetical protein
VPRSFAEGSAENGFSWYAASFAASRAFFPGYDGTGTLPQGLPKAAPMEALLKKESGKS